MRIYILSSAEFADKTAGQSISLPAAEMCERESVEFDFPKNVAIHKKTASTKWGSLYELLSLFATSYVFILLFDVKVVKISRFGETVLLQ